MNKKILDTEALKSFIESARLAPSSHNCQPWIFKIVNENSIEVWGDENRRLVESDKNNRQFFISIGCALENLRIAADYFGYDAIISFFPEPSHYFHVATISFEYHGPSSVSDHLFFSIPKRHSNREAFASTPIPATLLESIKKMADDDVSIDCISDDRRQNISTIVENATAAAFKEKGFCDELSNWIRPSLKKYKDGMPGYNIGVPWIVSFFIPFAIKNFNVIKQQVGMVKKMLDNTPTFLIISTKEDNRSAWVRIGMVWERIALMVTAAGANIGMLAAPIQIGEFYKELQKTINTHYRPQTFSRLGFSGKVPKKSPRLQIEDIIR